MTTDILAAIDGSLRDYETSRDAMRWNPGLREAREAAVPAVPASPVQEITVDLSGFIVPLAADGHEHHRRQLARARSRRGH